MSQLVQLKQKRLSMKYFNGFSLSHEEIFFKEQLLSHDYCVAGFSYGAIEAFEYAYKSQERIDRLILLSPAFFQNHKKSFIRTQLRYYKLDKIAYTKQFLENVVHPSSLSLSDYFVESNIEELEKLLTYVWNKEKIIELLSRGIEIEVFMGEEDKIVNSVESFNFFKELVTCYFYKDVGHLLYK